MQKMFRLRAPAGQFPISSRVDGKSTRSSWAGSEKSNGLFSPPLKTVWRPQQSDWTPEEVVIVICRFSKESENNIAVMSPRDQRGVGTHVVSFRFYDRRHGPHSLIVQRSATKSFSFFLSFGKGIWNLLYWTSCNLMSFPWTTAYNSKSGCKNLSASCWCYTSPSTCCSSSLSLLLLFFSLSFLEKKRKWKKQLTVVVTAASGRWNPTAKANKTRWWARSECQLITWRSAYL